MKRAVVLSAGNIAHYHHTAVALEQAGLLLRYLCTFSGKEVNTWWARLLPPKKHKRLLGKIHIELDSTRVQTFPLPYLVTQTLRHMRVISSAHANEMFGTWYDSLTIPFAQENSIFHFVGSMGLQTAEQAAKRGAQLICDVRTAHILEEEDTIREEYARLGMNYQPTRTPGLRRRMLAEYDLADELFVMSTYARNTFLRHGFPQRKVHVIPLGVDTQRFAQQSQPVDRDRDDVFRIIFVGQILPRKGLHYLLDAIRLTRVPKSELLILGSIGDSEYAHRYMSPHEACIRFMGHVPQIELQRIYQMADVFVLPSISDGFALVVSEAMAMGLPVVVTENVGARDLVRDEIDGFVVPVRSAEALAEKLTWLYEHPDARQTMGIAAKQQVQLFTWARYGKQLLTAYREIGQLESAR